jgi:hypothetical protein
MRQTDGIDLKGRHTVSIGSAGKEFSKINPLLYLPAHSASNTGFTVFIPPDADR